MLAPPVLTRQQLLDMRDRRVGQDAVAEIEDMRPVGEGGKDPVDRGIERRRRRRSARADRDCPGPAGPSAGRRAPRPDRPFRRRPIASTPGLARISGELAAGALGEADHRHVRMRARCSAATIRAVGAITQRSNCAGERLPDQLSNSCTASTPASIWPTDSRSCNRRSRSMMRLNACGIAIGEPARLALLAAALPGDHIGRDGPGAAGKAEERGFGRQVRRDPADGAIDRLEPLRRPSGGPPAHRDRRAWARAAGPSPASNHRSCPSAQRHHQDVGEQDRAVEAEAADRLQRDLGRRLAVGGELEEAALLRPQRAIFGEIAPRLAHQPDRGNRLPRTLQRREQGLGGREVRASILILYREEYKEVVGDVGAWMPGLMRSSRKLPTA